MKLEAGPPAPKTRKPGQSAQAEKTQRVLEIVYIMKRITL